MVTWFVSNCNSCSGRYALAIELQKIINVDIYGTCSGKNLPHSNEKSTLSAYKFYLSFENSKCPEYATEKIYKILNMEISEKPPVPIVLGPNRTWYENNLPQNSFIHVDDFNNPLELGNYLLHLNEEHDQYFKYLDWRRHYKSSHEPSLRCQMCEKLVQNDTKQNKPFVITDFESFWSKNDCDLSSMT